MDKINNLFDQEITKTINAYPSIYTKDDVISLLSSLRTTVLTETANALTEANAPYISKIDFQNFNAEVINRLEKAMNDGSIDLYDYSSAEFGISYNNVVEVESLDFNSDSLTDELSDILLDQFQESFGKFLTLESE